MDRYISQVHRYQIAVFFDVDIHEVYECHKEKRYAFYNDTTNVYDVYDYINEVTFHYVGSFSFILDALRILS